MTQGKREQPKDASEGAPSPGAGRASGDAQNAEAFAALPPLREVIENAGLWAKKSLGQNYLLDLNITRRIAKAADPLAGVTVIEVGPGPGGLTRALFMEGAAKVVAIEKDERFGPALELIAAAAPGRLEVCFADALEVDFAALASQSSARRIVANLPYNVATALMTRWLAADPWPPWYDKFVVLVQREVADRLIAKPGTGAYGRLSVYAQARATPKILFTLPPRVFTPSPKVESALIEVVPHEHRPNLPMGELEAVTAAAFGQRRKMLRSSLRGLHIPAAELLAAAGIAPSRRAEELSVDEFVALAECVRDAMRTRTD